MESLYEKGCCEVRLGLLTSAAFLGSEYAFQMCIKLRALHPGGRVKPLHPTNRIRTLIGSTKQ